MQVSVSLLVYKQEAAYKYCSLVYGQNDWALRDD